MFLVIAAIIVYQNPISNSNRINEIYQEYQGITIDWNNIGQSAGYIIISLIASILSILVIIFALRSKCKKILLRLRSRFEGDADRGGNAGAWINKGNIHQNRGEDKEALQCYIKAIELDPKNVGAWINKGNIHQNRGEDKEALQCYIKAIELDPKNVGAWINKGNIHQNRGEDEEALQCYIKAIELDPKNAGTWINKGNIHQNRGEDEEALQCYNEANKLDPKNAST